jgi:hypothetical protein
MTGATLQEVEGYIEELESAGVFMRDDEGCIYSKRMIRDEEIRQSRAAGGSKGGNPALLAKKTGPQKDNLPANLQPTPSSSSSSSSSSSEEEKSARSSSARAARFDALAWLTERGVDDQLASDWLVVRKQGKGANTVTAFEAQAQAAEKAGISLSDAVRFCVTQPRPWVGFNADWYAERTGRQQQSALDLAQQVQRTAGPRNPGGYVSKQEQLERNNRAVVERFAARIKAEEAEKGNSDETE